MLALRTVLSAVAVLAVSACSPAAGVDSPAVLGPDEAVGLLAERDDVTVIDVRTPQEHAAGHLAGSRLVDIQRGDFTDRVGELDPDGAYLLYCRTGNRTAVAAELMDELGFTEVYDAGGFDDLVQAGAEAGGT